MHCTRMINARSPLFSCNVFFLPPALVYYSEMNGPAKSFLHFVPHLHIECENGTLLLMLGAMVAEALEKWENRKIEAVFTIFILAHT